MTGCRLGGGKQRIPRIALLGVGAQVATISGNTFGAFGAHRVCPSPRAEPDECQRHLGQQRLSAQCARSPERQESAHVGGEVLSVIAAESFKGSEPLKPHVQGL